MIQIPSLICGRKGTLDPIGNITSVKTGNATVTRSANGQNELTTVGNATIQYDPDGNTITDDLGNTDTYNAWNMLMSVKSGNTTLSAFTYDGLGHRITESPDAEVTSGNATDLYYSAAWQVLQENQTITSGNTTVLSLQTRYVWSPVYVNAMVLRDYDFNADGIMEVSDRTYVTQDANYNVTGLYDYDNHTLIGDINSDLHVNDTDLDILLAHWQDSVTADTDGDLNGDGFVDIRDLQIMTNNLGDFDGYRSVEHFAYSAYGLQTCYTGNWSGTTSDTLDFNYGFQDGREDKSTGLINFQERDYNPRTYTWDTKDPLGFVNGPDVYEFVKDGPINFVDPNGLQAKIGAACAILAMKHFREANALATALFSKEMSEYIGLYYELWGAKKQIHTYENSLFLIITAGAGAGLDAAVEISGLAEAATEAQAELSATVNAANAGLESTEAINEAAANFANAAATANTAESVASILNAAVAIGVAQRGLSFNDPASVAQFEAELAKTTLLDDLGAGIVDIAFAIEEAEAFEAEHIMSESNLYAEFPGFGQMFVLYRSRLEKALAKLQEELNKCDCKKG